jgi:hypothetical protein
VECESGHGRGCRIRGSARGGEHAQMVDGFDNGATRPLLRRGCADEPGTACEMRSLRRPRGAGGHASGFQHKEASSSRGIAHGQRAGGGFPSNVACGARIWLAVSKNAAMHCASLRLGAP